MQGAYSEWAKKTALLQAWIGIARQAAEHGSSPSISVYNVEWWVWLTYIYSGLGKYTVQRNPRKINRAKVGKGSSAKILVLENF